MEGFSNWIKIEGMVSFYCSNGNSEQFKKVWDRDTHTYTHTHTLTQIHSHMYTHTCMCTHTHTCTLTIWTKAKRVLAKQACVV